MNPFLFENGDFLSGLAYHPLVFSSEKMVTENASFKNAVQSWEFYKQKKSPFHTKADTFGGGLNWFAIGASTQTS